MAAIHRTNSFRLFEGKIVKVVIDKPEGCGDVEVNLERATSKDIRQARAADPANARKLLELVRKDKESPYRRTRCGFAAILKATKK